MTFLVGFFMLMFGIIIGHLLTAHKWSSNANHPYRIYYRGRLFKVSYDDQYED